MLAPLRQFPLIVTVSPTSPTAGETEVTAGRLASVQLSLVPVAFPGGAGGPGGGAGEGPGHGLPSESVAGAVPAH